MKKTLTLLTFVFLTNTLIFGQCPDSATPSPPNRVFNMSYVLETDRDAAWDALESITFPAGPACMCGATVTIAKADLEIDGPVSSDNVYRIRAKTNIDDYFGGVNGSFEGNITFLNTDGSSVTCDYMTTSNSNINGSTPVELFPNPVKDQLTLINGEGQGTIYNVLGQTVKELTIDANQANIQLAGFLNGQYYLRVLQEDGRVVTKQFSKVD